MTRDRPNQSSLTTLGWAALAGALTLTTPQSASAQPFGWVIELRRHHLEPEQDRLRVLNLATGQDKAAFVMPTGVEIRSNGVVTPDGRYYLVGTNIGIVRFRTDGAAFDRLIGPAGAVKWLALPASGTLVHALAGSGRVVVDWDSGAVVSTSCCEQTYAVYFTPDGTTRVEYGYQASPYLETLTAFSVQSGAQLWTHTMEPFVNCGGTALSDTYVAMSCTDYTNFSDVIAWSVGSGAEQFRVGADAWGLVWDGPRLLMSHNVAFPTVPRSAFVKLSAYTVPSPAETVIVERAGDWLTVFADRLLLTSDRRYAYWFTYHRSGDLTRYAVVELSSSSVISEGVAASGLVSHVALASCDLAAPAAVAGQLTGGTVNVPVTPAANCGAWTVPDARVLNPGPHTGPATLQVHTWPNSDATPRATAITVGTQPVIITQPSGVPTAPDLQATASDDRVALSLTPAIGAGITSFVVRGAIAGNPLADLLTLPAHLRSWTSPPLPPNEYEVEVVAANGAGRSQPSTRITLSLGSNAVPNPPEHLVAMAVDDRVELSWSAAPGPVPSQYVIEATAAGNPVFLPVARSPQPSFVATRVPAGSWQVRVRGLTAGGTSPPSQVVAVTTAPCSSPPGPPTAVWAIWTPPAVSVRWSPPLAGSVEEYLLEAGSSPGAADLGQLVVPAGELAYTADLSSLSAYVRVRARNACGVSAPSADVPIVLYGIR